MSTNTKLILSAITFVLILAGLNSASFLPSYILFYIITAGILVAYGLLGLIDEKFDPSEDHWIKDPKILIASGILFLSMVLFINSSFLNSERLYKTLEVADVNTSELTFEKHRSVTLAMASKVANKILGQKIDGVQISSQYQLNTEMASVQLVNDELLWIIPLDYSSFAKWFSRDYIPGYVKISATNPRQAPELVTSFKMTASQNAFSMDSIERIAYIESGLKNVKTHFEVDENGKPFFISLVMVPSVVLSAQKVESVIVTDAQTKESIKVSVEDAQKEFPWIDQLVAEDYLEAQIEWYGEFAEGYWNTVFGGLNINKPTTYDGNELWFVKANGRTMFFTGMTSNNNNDQSLVQGILVDTKTREAFSFDLSGVMDENGAIAAMNAALGANGASSIKWHAVLPQPLMIDGVFYWGAAIVSKSNLFQRSALVKGNNAANVYIATTYNKAIHLVKTKSVYSPDTDSKTSQDDETVTISRKKLDLILKKVDELNSLVESFR